MRSNAQENTQVISLVISSLFALCSISKISATEMLIIFPPLESSASAPGLKV